MQFHDAQTCGGLLPNGEIDEPYDPAMRHSVNNGKLAKILVQRHEHSARLFSAGQNFIVPGILRPVAGPDNIMSGLFKRRTGAGPCAGIKQELQLPVSRKGSIRSWLTSRRA